MTSVLVAYATKYGSTREVAEAIGETLRGAGLKVDVMPAKAARDLRGYDAVVLGTALYYFMLRREAKAFMSRHRKVLSAKPFALFALGPFSEKAEELASARVPVDKYLAKATWLAPVAVEVFGGRLEPSRLRFPDNNPAMRGMEASDTRDWDAIRRWAEGLPGAFGAAPS